MRGGSVAGTKAAGDLGAEPSVGRVGVIGNLEDRAVRNALDFAGVAYPTPGASQARTPPRGARRTPPAPRNAFGPHPRPTEVAAQWHRVTTIAWMTISARTLMEPAIG